MRKRLTQKGSASFAYVKLLLLIVMPGLFLRHARPGRASFFLLLVPSYHPSRANFAAWVQFSSLLEGRKETEAAVTRSKKLPLSITLLSKPMTFTVVRSDKHSMLVYCQPTSTIEQNEAMVHTEMLSKPANAINLRTTSTGHLSASCSKLLRLRSTTAH